MNRYLYYELRYKILANTLRSSFNKSGYLRTLCTGLIRNEDKSQQRVCSLTNKSKTENKTTKRKKRRKERINVSKLNSQARLKLDTVSGLETFLGKSRTTFSAVFKFDEGKIHCACTRLGGHATRGERPYWFSSTDITLGRSLNIFLEFTLHTLQLQHNCAFFL